jgi:hypothetical protein
MGFRLKAMKYSIIGSGPCGVTAAFLLLRAGFEVEIIDVDSHAGIDSENLQGTLKLMGDSSAPYDVHQFLILQEKGVPTTFYRSKLSGGFSNVWGATWGAQSTLSGDEWERHHQIISEILSSGADDDCRKYYVDDFLSANRVCNCFDFINKNLSKFDSTSTFSVKKTALAINPKFCDCVSAGMTSCIHGSVWNSKSLLAACKTFDSFSYVVGFDVVKYKLLPNKVELFSLAETRNAEALIIAAGPIGTSEIILNSESDSRFLQLEDTQIGFFPIFRFQLRKPHPGGFAFSQFRVDFKFGKSGLAAHLQLYADAEIYLERILGKFPIQVRKILAPLIGVILPHLGIGIVYMDSKTSPSLSFSVSDILRTLQVQKVEPQQKRWGFKKRLMMVTQSLGFLPLLPVLIWSKPGESYHLGSAKCELFDEFGVLLRDSRISCAGSFSLPTISPGPITHSSMAQTSRLVEKIIDQNFERTRRT